MFTGKDNFIPFPGSKKSFPTHLRCQVSMFEKVYKNVNKEVYMKVNKEVNMKKSFTLVLSQCSNNIILH